MGESISASETPVPALTAVTANPLGILQASWNHWKRMARAVGVVQTRILMVVFYFAFVLPLGLIMRMSGDPLRLRRPAGGNWVSRND